MPPCGHCGWCASDKSMLCDYGTIIMERLPISDGVPRLHARGQGLRQVSMLGTFAPYVVAHEDARVEVEDDIPLDLAALVGCGVTTGYGAAVQQARVEPGDTVVVVGIGGVGSSAVQRARIAGAEVIVAVDPFELPYRCCTATTQRGAI
jgi:Zn-dependent alcohol dehydrogenase